MRLAVLRAYHGFIRHRGLDSAAALSFFAALVVFPAALSIVSAFALLDDKTHAPGDILRIVDLVAPRQAVAALHGPVEQLLSIPSAGVGLAVGIVLTMWTLSGYVTAFGRAINTAYEVQEGRRWVPLRLKSLVVSAALVVVFGAETDAEIVRARQLLAGIDAQDAIQLPVRGTRRIETLDRWRVEDEQRGRALLAREKRGRS